MVFERYFAERESAKWRAGCGPSITVIVEPIRQLWPRYRNRVDRTARISPGCPHVSGPGERNGVAHVGAPRGTEFRLRLRRYRTNNLLRRLNAPAFERYDRQTQSGRALVAISDEGETVGALLLKPPRREGIRDDILAVKSAVDAHLPSPLGWQNSKLPAQGK